MRTGKIKERIFARQNAGDLAILNADEETAASLCGRLAARTELFSSSGAVDRGMFLSGETLVHLLLREGRGYPLAMIHLPGRHNCENVMAAILAAELAAAPGDRPGG